MLSFGIIIIIRYMGVLQHPPDSFMDGSCSVHDIYRLIGRSRGIRDHESPVYHDPILYHIRPCKSVVLFYFFGSDSLYQKPVVALLQLPPHSNPAMSVTPLIGLPPTYKPTPDPWAGWKRSVGLTLDRLIGVVWWLLTLLGLGSVFMGLINFLVGIGAWTWWRKQPSIFNGSV